MCSFPSQVNPTFRACLCQGTLRLNPLTKPISTLIKEFGEGKQKIPL
jgi:hypothetical protein